MDGVHLHTDSQEPCQRGKRLFLHGTCDAPPRPAVHIPHGSGANAPLPAAV